MKLKPLSRRTLLRGAGKVAISLPFLESMITSSAYAQESLAPRYIGLFFPYGTVQDSLAPIPTENSWQLPAPYRELETMKNHLI